MRSILCLSLAFSLFPPLASVTYAQELPFQTISGNRVVVRGTVAGGHELAMLVDTGAECTVIDKRAAKRLQLPLLPQTVEYAAFGKVGRAPLAVVRDLKVGPISTSLACVVGDIPTNGVDMILGLNVLGKHNFEIDYGRRQMVFDPSDAPSASVPFEPDTMLIVVKARVRGESVRMLVDTGAAVHSVFQEGPIIWLLNNKGPVATTPHMGDRSRSQEVSMYSFSIGSTEWRERKAMAIGNPKPPSWDAVLSVGSLGLKQVYFDFEHRLLGWATQSK